MKVASVFPTCGVLILVASFAQAAVAESWKVISNAFTVPAEFTADYGKYKSPLVFNDGGKVTSAEDWGKRRQEILKTWESIIGSWPALIVKPSLLFINKTNRDGFVQHRVKVEIARGQTNAGYLLIPNGQPPFPAVIVPFYEPETSVGLGQKSLRDFASQLARRGFVALAIGSPGGNARDVPVGMPKWQPLSYLGYVAANCYNALAAIPEVDQKRIGIVGHSYGSKWAMFASCLYEKFACAAWSDGGIVFDETRPNVNYWEPWYLGEDTQMKRKPGAPKADNPRTGAYKILIERGQDLHELHALMAPRPFLVSGGSEDPPERWRALNHTVAVNALLGFTNRVGMTNRKTHDPTPESNEAIYAFFEYVLKERAAR